MTRQAHTVLIGDVGPIERLRQEVPAERIAGVELCTVEPLLAPYDMQTLDGESRRRELERRYSALRGRTLVRLVVVNLNPEQLQAQPSPLKRICDEWREISRRKKELLNEGAHEGVKYVTVIVTEEGEWRGEDREALEELASGRPRVVEGQDAHEAGQLPRHRCYLVTRLLELGAQGGPCFARDVWPLLVGALLEFLERDEGRSLDDPGLYAWRTVRVVADLQPELLERQTREVFERLCGRLLAKPEEDLFGEPLAVDAKSGESLEVPTVTKVAVEAIGTREWSRIDAPLLQSVVSPAPWEHATAAYASRQRQQAAGRPPGPEAARVQAWMGTAEGQPGRVAPGRLGELLPRAGWREALLEVQAAHARVAEARARVEAAWAEHVQAARAYVNFGELLLVGAIVGSAVSYAAVVAVVVAGTRLGANTGWPWLSAAWVAGWALAGVGIMLFGGRLLQRWRGERARDEGLRPLVDAQASAQQKFREKLAQVLREAAARADFGRRASVRRVLHHRLSRIEAVLMRELHWKGNPSRDLRQTTAQAAMAGLVEVRVPEAGLKGFEQEAAALADKAAGDFVQQWRGLLSSDRHQAGFVPVQALLRLCAGDSARLVNEVREKVQEHIVRSMSELAARETAVSSISKALDKAEVVSIDGRPRFYSVDLHQGIEPRRRAWVVKGLGEAFGTQGDKEEVEPGSYGAGGLGPGVIGLWHGEVQLEFDEEPGSGVLRFKPRKYGA